MEVTAISERDEGEFVGSDVEFVEVVTER